MTNVFNITITATDKATAVVRKVNDALDRVARPFKEVGKSFKGLGRELGFEKIGKNLNTIGASAATAARGIGSIVAPLASITGVASVGGVIALADSWAKVGRSVTYASQSTGVGVRGLQEIEGAAQLVGVASGAATQGLQSLGDTMQDALYGRNQQALMLFNRLGIGIKKTASGAVDAEAQFKALAGAISRLKNPQQQNLVAGQFGLTGLLPLLREGPGAIDKLTAKAHELGLVMSASDVAAGAEFADNLSALEASATGLKNTLGNALIPAIRPLVNQLADWVSKNRDLIASRVGEWAKDFGKWLAGIDWKAVGKGIADFGRGVRDLVDALGGWKGAAIAVATVMSINVLASVVSLTANLFKLGIGIGSIIAKFFAMRTAALAAGTAAETAAGAGAAKAAGAGAAKAAGPALATKAGIIGATLALSGDQSKEERNAQQLMAAAAGGDKGAALQLARSQLTHWWSGAPTNQAINERARQLMSGGVGGSDASYRPKMAEAMKLLQGMGWTRDQAAGIAANLGTESGFNPAAVGDGGRAYGLAQWHPDRQKAFAAWAGHSINGSSREEQLRFVNYELTQGGEKAAGDRLRRATDARSAADIYARYAERPADVEGEASRRGSLAASVAAPDGPYTSGAAKSGNVKVEVELKNAPAGTTATAKSTGNATTAPPRIGYSGVGATM